MGVHLFSANSESSVAISWMGWSSLLITARTHGWEPAGTVCPSIPDWGGSYHSNDGQIVTAEDAANLAQALHTALIELEGYRAWHEALEIECPTMKEDKDQPWYVNSEDYESEELALQNIWALAHVLGAMMGLGPDRVSRRNFLIRNATLVGNFIVFAKQGAFEIY